MHIQCNFEQLQKAIQSTQHIASKQASLPILSGVLLSARNGKIILRTTNLQVGFEVLVEGDIEKEGEVVVDAQVIQRIVTSVKKEKKAELIFNDESGELRIVMGTTELTVKTYPTDDFPTLPQDIVGVDISVPRDEFIMAVKAVVASASRSDIKPELSSVYMYQNGEEIVLVATDSFRLAEKKMHVKSLPDFDGILIPVKNMQDFIKVCAEAGSTIDFIIGENQLSARSGPMFATMRILDGNFPDYRQIIPKDVATSATMLVQDLVQTLRLVTIFSDKYNQIDLSINPSAKECTIASSHTDIGSSVNHIDAALEGDILETRINHTYVSDALQVINEDSITISSSGPSKPLVIRPVGTHDFVYLIMPMTR
jgi:DNA polymerase-3 subunit beta